jgi:uncharacterized protein (TIGR03086 family)
VSSRLDAGVELLERSLGYTRAALARVGPTDLTRPTPCDRWDLAALLAHMDDALDAFLEAAGGTVAPPTGPGGAPRPGGTDSLCSKACALLGAWTSAPPRPVTLAGAGAVDRAGRGAGVVMDPGLLVLTAALEITVHGWDVARALDLDHPVPPALAVDLLPVARALVGEGRFAPALAVAGDPGAPSGVRLLGAVGREADRPLRRTR